LRFHFVRRTPIAFALSYPSSRYHLSVPEVTITNLITQDHRDRQHAVENAGMTVVWHRGLPSATALPAVFSGFDFAETVESKSKPKSIKIKGTGQECPPTQSVAC
jgi:hypothetical protein